MIKAHKLKSNKKGYWPQQIIFVDTETTGYIPEPVEQEHHLHFGYAQYISFRNKQTKTRKIEDLWFYDTQTFYNWVVKHAGNNRKLIIIASNIWFDMRITQIDQYLASDNWINTSVYQEGLRTIISFKKDKKHIKFLSIQNWLPFSIKQIGEMIDQHKMEVNFETDDLQKLKKYCKQDVEILKQGFLYWRKICKENNFGNFGVTLSSQAFNCFRHKYMHHSIFIHDNISAIKAERESYFGGRTEAFYIGKIKTSKIYKLDINSMYPAIMEQKQFPTKLLYSFGKILPKQLKYMLKNYCIIAKITATIKEPFVAYRHQKRTLFPTGKICQWVCTETLNLLLNQNVIQTIHQGYLYTKSKIFTDYVQNLIKLKNSATENQNKLERKIYKLLLNSLYGKFGQKRTELKYKFPCDKTITKNEIVYSLKDEQSYRVIAYGGEEKWYTRTTENSYNSFTGIASHVTDYARCYLWQSIKKAGRENVYYVDTDSMFVNKQGLQNMQDELHQITLGKWKLEETTDNCIIKGPKWYVFGDKIKCKGISKSATETAENTYKQQYFPSFKTSIKDGLQTGYVIKSVTKHLSTDYKKAHVTKTGFTVPFDVSQLADVSF